MIASTPTHDPSHPKSSEWFWQRYDGAAEEIISFLAGDGLSMTGKEVADVWCGDGIVDLGLANKARPARLVGFDTELRTAGLAERARAEGVGDVPATLTFERAEPTQIAADDASFDFVVSWSTFEHVRDPVLLLHDVHRVLRPSGILVLQMWPFYHSEHGSHLWPWFNEGFVQLRLSRAEIERDVRANPHPDPAWAEEMLRVYASLNHLTLDGLQAALRAARFAIGKVELLTHAVHVPLELQRYPLSLLGVAGVKLLAIPR